MQPQQIQIVGDAKAVAAPDGTILVAVIIAVGPAQSTVVLPADQVDAWMEGLVSKVREVSAAARRQNGGLLVAPPGVVLPPLPRNGSPNGGRLPGPLG